MKLSYTLSIVFFALCSLVVAEDYNLTARDPDGADPEQLFDVSTLTYTSGTTPTLEIDAVTTITESLSVTGLEAQGVVFVNAQNVMDTDWDGNNFIGIYYDETTKEFYVKKDSGATPSIQGVNDYNDGSAVGVKGVAEYGFGVEGHSTGAGYGVYGHSDDGWGGVFSGESSTGKGVYAQGIYIGPTITDPGQYNLVVEGIGSFGVPPSGGASYFGFDVYPPFRVRADDVVIAAYESSGSVPPLMLFLKSNGTLASPTDVGAGDFVMSLTGAGYEGTTHYAAGVLNCVVTGVGSGYVDGKWQFSTYLAGSQEFIAEIDQAAGLVMLDDYPISTTTGDIISGGDLTVADAVTLTNSSGVATLVNGTVTVSCALATAGCKVIATHNTVSGTQGFLSAPDASIVNGVSFDINSSAGVLDDSTVNWMIIQP